MLILFNITINETVGKGLFKHAKNAAEGWSASQDAEAEIAGKAGGLRIINPDLYNSLYEQTIEQAYERIRPSLKIGDYVEYIPDISENNYMEFGTFFIEEKNPSGSVENPIEGISQEASLKWRVMSIHKDGSVDLVSDMPTTQKVTLKKALGYNNGVYLLNDLCREQYSN